MSNTFAINIGRQLGSGGRIIGKQIAQDFGIKFYDKELIYRAASESGFSEELFEQNDEHKGLMRSFFTSLIPFVGGGDIYGNSVSEESLFRILSDTVKKIADEENCVLIGRCTEYILRKKERCLNIFICADDEDRIKRISEYHKMSIDQAKHFIEVSDRRRAAFHDFYSDGAWGMASTYHLCINSSELGLEETTKFIENFISQKFNISLP